MVLTIDVMLAASFLLKADIAFIEKRYLQDTPSLFPTPFIANLMAYDKRFRFRIRETSLASPTYGGASVANLHYCPAGHHLAVCIAQCSFALVSISFLFR